MSGGRSVRTPSTPSEPGAAPARRELPSNARCAIMRSFSWLAFWRAWERSESKAVPLLKWLRRRNGPRLPPHLVPYAERRMEIRA